MKKVIIYTVVILSVFLTVSCTTDDFNENQIPVNNTEVSDHGGISTTPPKKKG